MKVVKVILSLLMIQSLSMYSLQTQAGGSIGVYIGESSARLGFDTVSSSTGLNFMFDALYKEDTGTLFGVGINAIDLTDTGKIFDIGVGAKVYYFSIDNEIVNDDSAAIALGGFIEVEDPRWKGLGLHARVYYAPDVSSFGDSEGVSEAYIEGFYKVHSTAKIVLGYRNTQVKFPEESVKFENGLVVGIKFLF